MYSFKLLKYKIYILDYHFRNRLFLCAMFEDLQSIYEKEWHTPDLRRPAAQQATCSVVLVAHDSYSYCIDLLFFALFDAGKFEKVGTVCLTRYLEKM